MHKLCVTAICRSCALPPCILHQIKQQLHELFLTENFLQYLKEDAKFSSSFPTSISMKHYPTPQTIVAQPSLTYLVKFFHRELTLEVEDLGEIPSPSSLLLLLWGIIRVTTILIFHNCHSHWDWSHLPLLYIPDALHSHWD